MDRLVSAYRNKLECRQGKEYYYKVGETSIYAVSHVNHDSFLKSVKNLTKPLIFSNMVKKLFRVTERPENSALGKRGDL